MNQDYEELEEDIAARDRIIRENTRKMNIMVSDYKKIISPGVLAAGLTGVCIVGNACLAAFGGNTIDFLSTGNAVGDYVLETIAYLPFEAIVIGPVIYFYSKSLSKVKENIKSDLEKMKLRNELLIKKNKIDNKKLDLLLEKMYENNSVDYSLDEDDNNVLVNSNPKVRKRTKN